MDILNVILTSLLSVIALFVITKALGHKQIAQLDFFDYVTGITIGSIGAEMATELEEPWKPLIAMLVYGIVALLLSIITSKCQCLRKFINGTPTVIMNNGKLYRDNMRKAKLDLSEFLVMCRQEGFFNLNDIQTAVFEYNGRLTILPTSVKRPANPTDLNLSPEPECIYTELIMDGHIMDENLKRKGLDIKWLEKQIKQKGYKESYDIFLAVCDDKNELTIYSME